MSNNLSPLWIKSELTTQRNKLSALEKALHSLTNRDTEYAMGISKMIDLRKEIIGIVNKYVKE